MKIEAGKYYRLRNGIKAYCRAVFLPDPRTGAADLNDPHTVIISYPSMGRASRQANGRLYHNSENPYDVVAEWTEPFSETVWLRIMRNKNSPDNKPFVAVGSDYYSTKDYELLGHKRVTVKEGEFDD